MAEKIRMQATQHFYDSNLNPKQVRRGQVFTVNDKVRARDFENVAVVYEGEQEPAQPDPVVPEGSVVGAERKAKPAPQNKMNPATENKDA